MGWLIKFVSSFQKRALAEKGSACTEYLLATAGVALIALACGTGFGEKVSATYDNAYVQISEAGGGTISTIECPSVAYCSRMQGPESGPGVGGERRP